MTERENTGEPIVISVGGLFLRDQNEMVCLDLINQQTPNISGGKVFRNPNGDVVKITFGSTEAMKWIYPTGETLPLSTIETGLRAHLPRNGTTPAGENAIAKIATAYGQAKTVRVQR